MRIAFCLYKYFPFGGLQRDFLRIALACQARGHAVRVYTLEWRGEVPEGEYAIPARGENMFHFVGEIVRGIPGSPGNTQPVGETGYFVDCIPHTIAFSRSWVS